MRSADPVRVAVCEDSAPYAEGLRHFLEVDGDILVSAIYPSAEQMLPALVRDRPDLLVVDLELPGLSGIEAIRRVMRLRPLPILVLSAHAPSGSRVAAEALACGAVEARAKSSVRLADAKTPRAAAFRRHVRRLARARVPVGIANSNGAALPAQLAGRAAVVVGIAASTGGPAALEALLAGLPADFAVPVLVVQHMTPGFIGGLAEWLDASVPPPVRMAPDRARLSAGVWLAPDGTHLVLDRGLRTRLEPERGEAAHVPSGNVLLSSLARSAGSRSVAVVLTGMGSDGAEGLAAVRAAGGLAIAQDEDTSAIYGMPRAAAAAGVDLELPPVSIAHVMRGLRAAGPLS